MTDHPQPERAQKIIDAKLPLSWLIGATCTIVLSFGVLYGNVERLVRDVGDLQITVKTGNAQTAALQASIAILQFRVEALEAERRRLATENRPNR